MALLDQFGNPIKKEMLLEESVAGTRAVRQTLSNSTMGIDPYKMAKILKASEHGNIDAYLSMAEEIEEKDTHYLSVISTRKRAVAQLEITVDSVDDTKAAIQQVEFIQDWLDRDKLEGEIFNILDAIGKGFSVTEIIWDLSASEWMPKDLIWRDPRLFKFAKDQCTVMIKGDGNENIPLDPYKFLVHRHQAKSGIPIRGGVMRPCAWMWLFKNFSVKDWVIFSERYGQPIRLGKYGSGATADDKDVLMRAVSMLGSDAAAIIPESMQIEFIESQDKKSNAEVFENLARFMDEQMSKAVLGQTTTTDAIAGGHAVSKEHNEVREDIERSDARQLSSVLNEQLIRPIIDLNFGVQKKYPRLRIGRQEQINVKELAEVAERSVNMGMHVSERKLRDKLGLSEPEDDSDILKPISTTAPPQQQSMTAKTVAAKNNNYNDAVGNNATDVAADYEEIMNPIIAILEDVAASSKNFAEFNQKLLEIGEEMNLDGFADKLSKTAFMANIAGQVDAKLED